VRCPYCESRDSKVIDSRASDNGVRRRRECIWCGERFSTLESVQRASVQIAKKDGRRESFQREKLFAGLQTACRKRPVPTAEIEAIVADIEARLAADSRAEVPSSLIGEMVMEALRDLDHIAYVRFASVYRGFADLDSLRRSFDELEPGTTQAECSRRPRASNDTERMFCAIP
jgi:transcriptional repressor NrdR